MSKILKLILVLVLLAFVIVMLVSFSKKENTNPPVNQTRQEDEQSERFRTYSSSATVKKIAADSIVVEVPLMVEKTPGLYDFVKDEKTVQYDKNTKFFTKSKSGEIKPATASAVRAGAQVLIESHLKFSDVETLTAVSITVSL